MLIKLKTNLFWPCSYKAEKLGEKENNTIIRTSRLSALCVIIKATIHKFCKTKLALA